MNRVSIIEWKSTTQLYVAVLQAISRFDPATIREVEKPGGERWLIGRHRGSTRDDLYAVAYRKMDLEFDEARERAHATVERLNRMYDQGRDPLLDRGRR